MDNLIKSDPKLQKTIQIDKNAKEAEAWQWISIAFIGAMIIFNYANLIWG
ncbi:hypothetical protein [Lacticaseibacillus rhamnosus]|nr:hypothetical protein [Lacticaseibacillus rhamnosus]